MTIPNELKNQLLSIKNHDEFDDVMELYLQTLLETIYEDNDIRQYLCKTFGVDKEILKGMLRVDGGVPIDDFDE